MHCKYMTISMGGLLVITTISFLIIMSPIFWKFLARSAFTCPKHFRQYETLDNPENEKVRCIHAASTTVKSTQQAVHECAQEHSKSHPPLPTSYLDADNLFEAVKDQLQPYDKRFVLGFVKDQFTKRNSTGWHAINDPSYFMNLDIFSEGEPTNDEDICVGVDAFAHYSYNCLDMHSLVCEVYV
ncbi:uncharacterized protein LOC142354339 isoform X2 [Convolutriloba macropyga]|uniref:uncharacterized protein LOC142354339 isoform X2 n=1 Tax=Convolutriloba macropyga TaxID=536237 RepID=UPI003F51D72B